MTSTQTTPPGPPASTTIEVGGRYPVHIGADAWDHLPDALGPASRVLLVSAPGVQYLAYPTVRRLREAGLEVVSVELPDAESAKTVEVAARLWSLLGEAGFTRTDAVVGLGGGATTDLAGFVAATWLRGVRLVTVPTTLLGMVDAAVGGKTGINTPEGKNLVGAFHEPAAVLIDPGVLRTLPQPDLIAGMGEVVKCGFIADPVILERIEHDPVAALALDGEVLPELIVRSVQVKANVVGADLREAGLREILNYGHTFGHAVEQSEGYRMRHGEAVAIGMIFVAELARSAGLLDEDEVRRHEQVLASLGLPTRYTGDADWDHLLTVMARDKKTRGALLRFVVLGPDGPTRLEGPSETDLAAAYARVTG